MKRPQAWLALLILIGAAGVAQAQSETIRAIEVSTVAGYESYYSPEHVDGFSLLGFPKAFLLSSGEKRAFGPGGARQSYAKLQGETVSPDGVVSFSFGEVVNGDKGLGIVFFHLGGVSDSGYSDRLWSEGWLQAVSPLIVKAEVGSTEATLTGVARIEFNNSSTAWGGRGEDTFLHYAMPEGALVPFSVTYRLTDGSTWGAGTFDRPFRYEMSGTIAMVPEPSSNVMMVAGLLLFIGVARVRGRAGRLSNRLAPLP